MTPVIKPAAAVLSLCPALCLASPAFAEEDVRLWITLTATTDIADNTRATLSVQPRFQLDDTRNDQVNLAAAVDHAASDFVTVGGGLVLLGEFGPVEKRPFANVTLGNGPLKFRTTAEFRFRNDTDRMEVRLRQRVQYTIPVAERTTAAVSGEIFYTAQNAQRGGDTRISQWRAAAQVSHRLSDQLAVSAGYMAIGVPVSGGEDRLSHVPLVGLAFVY